MDKFRYAHIEYMPDEDCPWAIHLYRGTVRNWGEDFMWTAAAMDHAEAIGVADDWINRRGRYVNEV